MPDFIEKRIKEEKWSTEGGVVVINVSKVRIILAEALHECEMNIKERITTALTSYDKALRQELVGKIEKLWVAQCESHKTTDVGCQVCQTLKKINEGWKEAVLKIIKE